MSEKNVYSSILSKYEDQKVTVHGRLHILRKVSKKLAFLILRDGDGLMQIVLENPQEIGKLENFMT
jgi:aspartyl/asparaginyl-tRNA synthetase